MQTQTEHFTVDVATQTEIYTKHVETSTKTLWHRINNGKGTQSSARECGSAINLSTPTKNNKEMYYFPIYIIMFSHRIPARRSLETRLCDD